MFDVTLNARVGRTVPGPLHLLPPRSPARGQASARPWPLLIVLLLALWPHWVWMARRLTDGSDEPWGILAWVTVLMLVVRDRRALVPPTRVALLASAALACSAAMASWFVPPIFAAGLALLALASFLTSALPRRPAAALTTLLLLALPIIASLQFYLGYPLRALTAQAAAPLLQLAGIDARAAGAALVWEGGTVLVDPPCAGIGMLWVGSLVAALLSYLNGADARRTALNGAVAAALVLLANVLRNAVLFLPESGLVHWPEAAHRAVGLAAFAFAIVPLVAFTQRAMPSLYSTITEARRIPIAIRFAPRAGLRIFFVGACLVAAVLSVLDSFDLRRAAPVREPGTAVAPSFEWPTHFRDRPLTQLALTPLEARFAQRFPGAIARFTDGSQLLIVRRADRPTRMLHPAVDCFRAAGYSISLPRAQVDDRGAHWNCFAGTRDGQRVRVCERIVAGDPESPTQSWSDVSAWYWSALHSSGPWWAMTVITSAAGDNA